MEAIKITQFIMRVGKALISTRQILVVSKNHQKSHHMVSNTFKDTKLKESLKLKRLKI